MGRINPVRLRYKRIRACLSRLRYQILAMVLAAIVGGCTNAYQDDCIRPDLPQPSPNREHVCFFVANASPVDFDDLILIHQNKPNFEGFFDIVYPISQKEEILRKYDQGAFSPEAEWVLFFKDPLPWKKSDFEKLDLSALPVRFQGMVEGKWLAYLQDKGKSETNDWIPASSKNNFYIPDIDPAALPSDFRTLAEWDEILGDADRRRPFDPATILVTHEQPGRQFSKQILRSSFKEMREEMFADGWAFYPSDLLRRICDVYYNDYSDSQRQGLRFQGVNLAAHGRKAALVNQPSRKLRGALTSVGDLFHPGRWGSREFMVRTKRHVARGIEVDGGIVGNVRTIDLVHIPPPKGQTLEGVVTKEQGVYHDDVSGAERTVMLPASDGTEIVLRYWKGEPGKGALIYIHGLMSHSGWVSPTGNWFHSQGFTCVAPDRRGSGRSEAPRGHMKHYNALIDDIQTVVQWTRSQHPDSDIHLASQCFGSLPVLCFAARHPDQATTLTLLSPAIDLHVDMTLWQKIQIGVTAYVTPKFPLPVPLAAEDFTELPDQLEWIRNNRLNLAAATARFYFQTVLMQREARRSASLIVNPVYLALAGNDWVCDNDAALDFFKNIACLDKSIRKYEGSLHSLEYSSKRQEFLEDWLEWLQTREKGGPGVE